MAETYINGGNTRDLIYGYNLLGNLTSKTSTLTGDTDVTGYGYGAGTAGPHAVTSATIAGTGITLTYDANGAVTTYDIAGTAEDRYLAYNAWNQPTKIVIGDSLNDTTPEAKDEFAYDPDGRRYARKTTWKDGSNTYTETVAYVGAVEIISDNSSGSAETVTKVRIGPNAMWVKIQGSSTQTFYEYAHRDHLGSIEVVTDGSGNVLDQLAFEPFGTRKAKTWTSNIPAAERDALLDLHSGHSRKARGFTGHEHLDRTGFVHANGRLYDPVLGRFLSPDPVVQAPGYSQSWNRYTYALSSPASLVDPSGFDTTQPSDDELPREPIDTVTVIGHGIGSGSIGGGSAIHFGHAGGGFSIAGAAGPRPTRPAGGGEGNACLWPNVECWVTVNPFMTVHAKVLSSNTMSQGNRGGVDGIDWRLVVDSFLGMTLDDWRGSLRQAVQGARDHSLAGEIFTDYLSPVGGALESGVACSEGNRGQCAMFVVTIVTRKGGGSAARATVGSFRMTEAVAGHAADIVTKGPFKGELARPFLKSPLVVREIMAAGKGVPDPEGVAGALRWDVPGTFRGTQGTWELVIKDDLILHFNFVGK